MQKVKEGMLRKSIMTVAESIIMKEFVTVPDDVTAKVAQIELMKERELDAFFRDLLRLQLGFCQSIESVVNELIHTSDGDLPITVNETVSWKGYVNETEQIVICQLEEGTKLNWLEFILHPIKGIIFQLCLDEGSKGHHFNIDANEAFAICPDLLLFIRDAARLAKDDEELDAAVYGEFMKQAQEIDDGSWS
ncbi:MAG: hypothetical protein ABJG42_24405 [Vibrio splendidus]